MDIFLRLLIAILMLINAPSVLSESPWYSLTGIIESDGKLKIIDEDYEDEYPDIVAWVATRAIADLDGDGLFEIVVDSEGLEIYSLSVYKYDGRSLSEEVLYLWGSDIG